MKKIYFIFFISIVFFACKDKEEVKYFSSYDETELVKKQQEHPFSRMRFKLFQSKYLDMNKVFKPLNKELENFSEEDYINLKPLILEKDIPILQENIREGKLTYEKLTLFYLYRIRKYESDSTKSLNAIISLNPNVVEEARKRDQERKWGILSTLEVYGMPILLKDNINTVNMPTTAGALALVDNKETDDAFIVEKLKENGALILGKVNLSEWAYYFCSGCPVGYSAVGGQSLNPYGRAKFETGGSSASSGTAVAANYAVAAIGTETAGSITSPSSQNSVVGLKPTVGFFSRSGIVPISSTLDTPGPMTKNVIDAVIIANSMVGKDDKDKKSFDFDPNKEYSEDLSENFKGKKIGIIKSFLRDSIYKANIEIIKENGAEIVELDMQNVGLPNFLTLLNVDMKFDLPEYLKNYADKNVKVNNVQDVINYNLKDTIVRAPYGQQLFDEIVKDTTELSRLEDIKLLLKKRGREFFKDFTKHNLDAILSINNYHAAYSAVAEYPNFTVPMGYKKSGEPLNLTFIGLPKTEPKLMSLGYTFEQLTKHRKMPKGYN